MGDAVKNGAVKDGAVKAAGIWCATLLVDGDTLEGVRISHSADGRITAVSHGVPPLPGDLQLATVVPGMADAHSHAFHRMLRGRTHGDGGDFWRWRGSMYDAAAHLDPQLYREVARAVFAEMLVSGWTAVGEFHYLHHTRDGTPYEVEHAMELAVVEAALDVGIRLVLLDTAYLAGGIGLPLEPAQRRFGDGSAERWLRRWRSLRERVAGLAHARADRVSLGAAIHSVRAVPADAIREIVAGLPSDVPLHVHLSEQPRENSECVAAYGVTPARLLHDLGALRAGASVVHATHLDDADIALIGSSGATVVLCPTTEADLGDGIGPARALADAGAPVALGSDQNAVVDPFLEMRALEAGERLASGRRGRFDPSELLRAATSAGYASLGLGRHSLEVGDWCDLVEVSTRSVRTVGSVPGQLPMAATASDVLRVVVGGELVAHDGRLARSPRGSLSPRPENLLRSALAAVDRATGRPTNEE
jgi:formiminoglutamate deiminase